MVEEERLVSPFGLANRDVEEWRRRSAGVG